MILLVLALVALVLPAPAAEEYARYDLRLNQLMFRHSAVSLEAGSVVEDWQSAKGGISNAEALARLEGLLKNSAALTREVESMAPPASARALHTGAVRTARGRTDLIRAARNHVARGNPTPQSQTAFMVHSLTANSEMQARWLSDRLEAARSAPAQSTKVRDFYLWQTRMLPLTRTQVKIGSDVQKLVFLSQGSNNVSLPAIITEAGAATTVSFELRDKAAAIAPPQALARAHRLAREEQACLSELCAEVKNYAGDRAEENVNRVRYAFRQLRLASQAAEEASLQALASALNAR